ncbi:MAG: undecaprenyl-diphosphate phosphatase [Candidatus Lindowbacteria bacterium]|nr:undecaprenyl-diphosphate phosphatase [Candidatus Lindowbacteria bacterium]
MQGVTEFLPVSSDGHLVIFQNLFGMTEPQVLFDVMLHMGTLAAILIVFRKEVGELIRAALRIVLDRKVGDDPNERMLLSIAVGCIPTAIIGVVFADQFERMFASVVAAGIGLMITGVFLASTLLKKNRAAQAVVGHSDFSNIACSAPAEIAVSASGEPGTKALFSKTVPLGYALLIGTGQGLAIAPGISRSGTTIAIALLLGVDRELAARFSFLMAIPAILGAFLFEMRDYSSLTNGGEAVGGGAILLGTLAAMAMGIVALKLLLNVVKRGRISLFAYYCWAVGVIAIAVGIIES